MSERRPRRTWRWVVLGVALVLAIPAMWLGGHRLSSRNLPEAPWSDADLPRIPDAEVNGLDDLMGSRTRRVPAVDWLELLTVSIAPETGPAARWREVEQRRDDIADMCGGPEHGHWIGVVDAMLGAEQFVDACEAASECGELEPVALLRFAAIGSLHQALQGRFAAALARAHRLVVAAHGWLRTARSIDSHRVAVLIAQMSIDHARVLVAGWRSRDRAPEETVEVTVVLEALDHELQRMDRREHTGRRAVVASCRHDHTVLAEIVSAPHDDGRIPGGPLAPYLVDARATLLSFDDECRALMAWVEAPEPRPRRPPPPRPRRAGYAWWLWNPGGKVFLDDFTIDRGESLGVLDELTDLVFASRDELRREIASTR